MNNYFSLSPTEVSFCEVTLSVFICWTANSACFTSSSFLSFSFLRRDTSCHSSLCQRGGLHTQEEETATKNKFKTNKPHMLPVNTKSHC